ncbi:MAG: site-specific DNA-methyltransferase [Cytophagia bacterium]|nr:MAG: site-specific DNA-methyltransferase [Cytophagia bacterium]TAG43065.1 MAG: site-specific DNA-methyltransferase [Cytophagia bacterium]
MFYNIDCREGAKKYLQDNSVDLIITDPPYGIDGDLLHKHYNRDESQVLDGYIEVPLIEYADFSVEWIKEAERVLKFGGSLYIISGYTNLIHILNALEKTELKLVNHIIWKYNFGVYTKKKYISSHYHILFYQKKGGNPTFNTFARFGDSQKDEQNKSLNYQDREDVWLINKEYKPNQIKNKNELPTQLLTKIIQYSSNENDLVCDFFLGSFSTAKVALALNRNAVGFEKNPIAFDYQSEEMKKIEKGSLLKNIKMPDENKLFNQGKPLLEEEINQIIHRFKELKKEGNNKKQSIEILTAETGRGYWSLIKLLDKKLAQQTTLL